MVETEQLNEQVESLVDMSERIEKLKDDIAYLVEIKDETHVPELRQKYAEALEKRKLVVAAITKRAEKLDDEHRAIFEALVS